jgi:uncharacterized protein (TIRG00374 family)
MMLTEKPSFKKWVTLSAVLGFAAFMAYLVFFTDFTEVAVVIGGTNVPVYILAFAFVIGSAVFNALTWKKILDNLAVETTFSRIFSLSWVGHFIDSLIPGGWTGDVFITYLLSKDKDVEGAKAAASIIIKDVLELFVVLGSLIVGMVLLALNYSISSLLMFAVGVTLVFLAVPLILIIYLSTNVGDTKKLLRAVERFIARIKGKPASASSLEDKINHQLTDFRDGIMSIKSNPKSMAKPIFFQTMTWIFDVLALLTVFIALGTAVGLDKVIITNTVVSTIQGQGVALAGFSQIIASELYTALGIPWFLAVASSLLAGFASFWFRLVVSFAYFQTTVFERCIPFLCSKCMGWRAWRTKSCPEPKPKKLKKFNPTPLQPTKSEAPRK